MADKSDIKSVAELELGGTDKLTSLQQEMYLTDKLIKSYRTRADYDPSRDDESVPTPFMKKIKKILLSTDISEKMPITPGSEGNFTFTVNDKMDFLTSIYKFRQFPSYKVKEQFKDKAQICWTHNLGHNDIIRLDLIIDDEPKQTITSTWLDIYSQFFVKSEFRKEYRKYIGDRKYAPKWGSEIPAVKTITPLPFFFDRSRNASLPLFLTEKSKITIKGTFRTKISDLLKMRFRADENSPWIEVPYRWELLEGVHQENQKIDGLLEFHATYSKITTEEKGGWIEMIQEDSADKSYSLLYDDIVIMESNKPCSKEDPFDQELHCNTTAKGVFWVAQNQDGLKYNNYSNYTTNPLDISAGKNPITTVGIKHGGTSSRCQNMDAEHFQYIQAYYRLPSTPFEPGYFCQMYSPNPMTTDADIGPIFNDKVGIKTNLILTVAGGEAAGGKPANNGKLDDIIKSTLDLNAGKHEENLPKFKVFVLILCIKKMQFFIADKVKVHNGSS